MICLGLVWVSHLIAGVIGRIGVWLCRVYVALCCCLLVAHAEIVFSFVASLLFDRKIISLVHSHYVCLFIVVFTQCG